MIALGEQSGRFTIEHIDDRAGGTRLEVANFRFLNESPHEQHGFQLMARREKGCERRHADGKGRVPVKG